MLEEIIKFIYPPKCGICGKFSSNYLCFKCKKRLEEDAIWEIKKTPQNFFEEQISIFTYQNLIRDLILEYKFCFKPYLYHTFTNFLIKNKKVFQKIKSYDIIIPVPISMKRKFERGFNQSNLIAKGIAKSTGIELVTNCIRKTKNTTTQSTLNGEERRKNVQNVYKLENAQILKNKKILVIDDVITTGSTLNSCCKVIREAEPAKIGVLVLAKD